jgi:hypothetical protein
MYVLVARLVVLSVKVVMAVGREMAAEVVVELAVAVVVAVVVEVEVAVMGGVLLSPQNVHHHIDYFIQ